MSYAHLLMILSLKAYDTVKVKHLDSVGNLINFLSELSLANFHEGTQLHMGVIY